MEISTLYQLFLEHPQVTTDSRKCVPGAIFFALKGANFNGNAYARKALDQGCAYAVVDEEAYADANDSRVILVDDVLLTLQKLANYHRRALGLPIIGITGTNGKTTTKELLATVLSRKYTLWATQGNLNNQIGVPLTLLQLTKAHQLAIIEMGASHPGDIKELVEIAEPDFGLITNVGMAHLLGFGSFEGVIRTKGELYDFLRHRPSGLIFLNDENNHLKQIAGGLQQVTYGRPSEAARVAVNGEVVDCAPFLRFRWRVGMSDWHEVQTQLIGSYNLDNMLAAITIGRYFEVSPDQIDSALAAYVPRNNRSQLMETGKNRLIVDAYNANPTSMMAALVNFRDMAVAPKMAILGDMKELGEISQQEHQRIVDFLAGTKLENIWLVGSEFTAVALDGMRCFENVEEVNEALNRESPSGYYILIKGSNSMKLFQTIDRL